LALYGVHVGTDDGQRVFVRRHTPQVNARSKHLFGSAIGNTLTRIDYPLIELDDNFDLVISPSGVVALNQKVFEDTFKYSEVLQQRIPGWVQDIASVFPMQEGVAEFLTTRGRSDSRIRRRLYAVNQRGHLKSVTMDALCQNIKELGLEGKFIKNDKLFVTSEHIFDFMALLNEDFFTGGLTKDRFRSDRKSLQQ